MSDVLLPNEPYEGDEGLCAICDSPISLGRAAKRFDGVAEAPDGLPAPVFVLTCDTCAEAQADED